ncbi:MAG: hypothetical protein ACYSU6_00625 [Planctomycetota bacterium]
MVVRVWIAFKEDLSFEPGRCKQAFTKRADYFPSGLKLPATLEDQTTDYIGCLYCSLGLSNASN